MRKAFTLIELLVVVGVISILIGVLLPALSSARRAGQVISCMSNMRQMEIAHTGYALDNDGEFVQANLSHGGIVHTGVPPWFETLKHYYGDDLVARSPLDTSPHWGEDGLRIPGAPIMQRRITSYGINNFLDNNLVPWGPGFQMPFGGYNMNRVQRSSTTVHFLIMAYEGEFAGADHPHVESWMNHPFPPFRAQEQVQINAARGREATAEAVSNYGFLDGHAETLPFADVFEDINKNRFDPSASP